jgi:hypothetical protein
MANGDRARICPAGRGAPALVEVIFCREATFGVVAMRSQRKHLAPKLDAGMICAQHFPDFNATRRREFESGTGLSTRAAKRRVTICTTSVFACRLC